MIYVLHWVLGVLILVTAVTNVGEIYSNIRKVSNRALRVFVILSSIPLWFQLFWALCIFVNESDFVSLVRHQAGLHELRGQANGLQ